MARELTPRRRAVLEAVRASSDHPTARQVFARAARKSPGISFATVYNALKYLAGAGLVRTAEVGAGEAQGLRYDGVTASHDHWVCTRCGEVRDLHGLRRPKPGKDYFLPEGFSVEDMRIQITGVCAACGAKARRGKAARRP